MRHARAIIRQAFVDRLKTPTAAGAYLTVAQDRVFNSRVIPVDVNDDDELPAILVYGRDEHRDPLKDYGPDADDSYLKAEVRLVVEAIVRGGKQVDDLADDIAFDIEAALEDWDVPGFEGATVRLGATDIDVVTEGFKKPVGAVGLVWHVYYERPWRVRPAGTRPDTVDIIINGGTPERLITKDKGIYNP